MPVVPSPRRPGPMPANVYHKRFRMEADLRGRIDPPELPAGCDWVGWDDTLLERHAEVKLTAFAGELDADIFPGLGRPDGCAALMRAIRYQDGFCPGATWLVGVAGGWAGTVQGLADADNFGAIQNLGVVPAHRGRGLGAALLAQALIGFQAAGLRRATLEVTAANAAAVALYRRYGFRCVRTIYKPAPVSDAAAVG